MSYKIAVASTDGINIDLAFGAANEFLIYEVDQGNYIVSEIREWDVDRTIDVLRKAVEQKIEVKACGCGDGIDNPKVELIEDCRCLLCSKIGPPAKRQLENKNVSVFDVEAKITDALEKVISYYTTLTDRKSKSII
jgi:predicted Fe-Mo cluster-binding NifX family protein